MTLDAARTCSCCSRAGVAAGLGEVLALQLAGADVLEVAGAAAEPALAEGLCAAAELDPAAAELALAEGLCATAEVAPEGAAAMLELADALGDADALGRARGCLAGLAHAFPDEPLSCQVLQNLTADFFSIFRAQTLTPKIDNACISEKPGQSLRELHSLLVEHLPRGTNAAHWLRNRM